jgi:hypothetical protein
MAAILDRQNGKRYGQAQFINEVVDAITSTEGRQPCYGLLDGLIALREGRTPAVTVVTLSDERGVPERLLGTVYELVDGESDAERRVGCHRLPTRSFAKGLPRAVSAGF